MDTSTKEVNVCRICPSDDLREIVNLGEKPLTGVFIKPEDPDPIEAPLNLVCCGECKFLQLKHDVDKDAMYSSYWYRSGTNMTMTNHLKGVVEDVKSRIDFKEGDIVIDTGCNDGTLLRHYPKNLTRIGVDPSNSILDIEDESIIKINNYFTKENVRKLLPEGKAKVITSISMFYDLSDPHRFVDDVKELLSEDGIWIVEMNYTGDMIESLGYDMISHEHVAYYTLLTFEYLIQKCELFINDVSYNSINGGSIRLFVGRNSNESNEVKTLRKKETDRGYLNFKVYENYKAALDSHKDSLTKFINKINNSGKVVMGYGASTRGNTVMQHCDFNREDIPAVLDRNPIKYGLEMAGCRIPIISEKEGREAKPDYLLVLPYYFIDEFIEREMQYLKEGGKFIVFLPRLRTIEYKDGEIITTFVEDDGS
jgi:hypothetical protein